MVEKPHSLAPKSCYRAMHPKMNQMTREEILLRKRDPLSSGGQRAQNEDHFMCSIYSSSLEQTNTLSSNRYGYLPVDPTLGISEAMVTSIKSPIWFSIWRNCPACTDVRACSILEWYFSSKSSLARWLLNHRLAMSLAFILSKVPS